MAPPDRPPVALADAPRLRAVRPFADDAPNILVIVLDDLGFAQLGCYGSDLDTPHLDRLASRGLRFTNFHTTAVCSPTRACLLTGRNHHRVGIGMLSDLPFNYPGYTGRFPVGTATLAQILSAEGYATHCIGKWHLTPRDERGHSGPFGMWPLGVGFERYYGFLNGETNQWTPNLVRDNSHVLPPRTPDEGYHLTEDLVDEAIGQIGQLRQAQPERPFLLWFATGAPHAPHQVPAEWMEHYAGRFDGGWTAWSEATLARQIELGIVPPDTVLPDRPGWVPDWNTLPADERRLYARMMEAYAGFVTHTDHHLGRLLDALERRGELDDTVVVVLSDNGASAEGGPHGAVNDLIHLFDLEQDVADEIARIDDIGGHRSTGHYPWGWALAGNTPLRRWKRYTYEGGVRDPLLVSWPAGIADPGGLRNQYCHVVDLLPTLLQCCGLEPPSVFRGVEQMSYDGVSLRSVFDDAAAPDPRTTQYYECWGSRAIYHDGWKAVTNHVNQLTPAERETVEGSASFADDRWALFDTRSDFNERHDRAADEPERLAALVELWFEEAERNQVLPIDDGRKHRLAHAHLPWARFRSHFEFRPGERVHEVNGPYIPLGFRLVAELGAPLGDATGVLCEQGDWNSGWAWFIADGEICWVTSNVGRGEIRVRAPAPPEARLLTVTATPRAGDPGFTLELGADGRKVGAGNMDVAFPMAFSPDGSFLQIGFGTPFPVCDDYDPPARFSGDLRRLVIDAGTPPPLDLAAELERVMRYQ